MAGTIAGLAGALFYIVNYARLTLGRTTADDPGYVAVNIAAASLVLCSLPHAFNPAALVLQSFFLAIGVVGLAVRLRRRRPRAGARPGA